MRRQRALNIPNSLTLLRIISVPIIIILLLKYRQSSLELYRYTAIIIYILAIITDALDGAIARLYKMKTDLGTILDPLADKLLLISTIFILSLPFENLQRLPYWIAISVISRDIFLFIGSFLIHMVKNHVIIKPNLIGKLTTLFQMLMVMGILFRIPYAFIIWRCAGVLTIISCIVYIYDGITQIGPVENTKQ